MSGSTPGSVARSSSTCPGSMFLMAWAVLITGVGHCTPWQSTTCAGASIAMLASYLSAGSYVSVHRPYQDNESLENEPSYTHFTRVKAKRPVSTLVGQES